MPKSSVISSFYQYFKVYFYSLYFYEGAQKDSEGLFALKIFKPKTSKSETLFFGVMFVWVVVYSLMSFSKMYAQFIPKILRANKLLAFFEFSFEKRLLRS